MNRVTIKFGFKAGLSVTEKLVLMQKAYGNEAVNRSKVFRWYSRFRDGRELVEDQDRVDNFFRLSSRSVQTIRTRRKKQ
jgi:hypothetical protein